MSRLCDTRPESGAVIRTNKSRSPPYGVSSFWQIDLVVREDRAHKLWAQGLKAYGYYLSQISSSPIRQRLDRVTGVLDVWAPLDLERSVSKLGHLSFRSWNHELKTWP